MFKVGQDDHQHQQTSNMRICDLIDLVGISEDILRINLDDQKWEIAIEARSTQFRHGFVWPIPQNLDFRNQRNCLILLCMTSGYPSVPKNLPEDNVLSWLKI